MNMKKKIKNISARNLWQGVAGICFSVTVFVLPFNAQAEGAMNAAEVKPAAVEQNASETPKPKYVMPQEQVYLDPSQEEVAKKQQEADAIYNSVPQNHVPAVDKEKTETAEIKANENTKPAEEANVVVTTETTKTETTARAVKEENRTEKAAVPQSAPEAGQLNYVMPQEQVYLDPSQVEAAKKQKEADAEYNSQPQTKNLEVVTGNRVIANVKVVEKQEKENAIKAQTNSETKQAEENKNVTVQHDKTETEKHAVAATKEVKEIKTVKEVKPEVPKPQEAVKEKPETPKDSEGNVTQPETKNETKNETKKETTTNVTSEEKNIETKNITPQSQITPRKKPVRLHHFGLAKEVTTNHSTVGEVLQDMRINLEGRTVYPSPETKISDGMVIHVLARKSFLSKEEVEVPFGTKIIEDPALEFGTKKVEKEGVKGKDLVIYENITRPGREQKIELDRRRIAEPVNEIVRKGVAQSVLTPNGYVKYKKVIYGEATAYTWGGGASGTTSIGLWPKRGIVAVDPRQIPYYTKLYIPGYGMAIAGDTGGAIVGNRIDLFMDSLYECYQWGRRDVEIYILE